jgi:dGTPase
MMADDKIANILLSRQAIELRERETLSPHATFSGDSLGRLHLETEHEFRTAFQRDRDRLIHCTAFRRLEYKTQVFVNREGDYYRTRLTHTLEVVQIARSLARFLRLNEDLAEAMALAHDLGHTPFGHTVEGVLNLLMRDEGGFEHNAQGLRCVDILEAPYPHFPGNNLTYEVRSIFTKRSSMADLRRSGFAAPESERFDSGPSKPILEAQVVDLADGVAYNSHDLDDGIKSGLLSPDVLREIPLLAEIWDKTGDHEESLQRRGVVRELINRQVTDIARETARRMSDLPPGNTGEEHGSDYPPLRSLSKTVDFSPKMKEEDAELKEALNRYLYRHPKVTRKMNLACSMIERLFETYSNHPEQMAPQYRARAESEPVKRVVCDYIAGMTDRFAEEEYISLFVPDALHPISR